jgi:hypothetical protein
MDEKSPYAILPKYCCLQGLSWKVVMTEHGCSNLLNLSHRPMGRQIVRKFSENGFNVIAANTIGRCWMDQEYPFMAKFVMSLYRTEFNVSLFTAPLCGMAIGSGVKFMRGMGHRIKLFDGFAMSAFFLF